MTTRKTEIDDFSPSREHEHFRDFYGIPDTAAAILTLCHVLIILYKEHSKTHTKDKRNDRRETT